MKVEGVYRRSPSCVLIAIPPSDLPREVRQGALVRSQTGGCWRLMQARVPLPPEAPPALGVMLEGPEDPKVGAELLMAPEGGDAIWLTADEAFALSYLVREARGRPILSGVGVEGLLHRLAAVTNP